ncbi:MAG TPA: DNA-3-methyladenine glycosylase I [Acidimicrobiales bacterium]|nr:DNA-3-methyladenine glycosylase I [Acidimicrobiales bacterium]
MAMSTGLVVGEDGRARCPWAASAPEYLAYHDDEWGRPVAGDETVYEHLCLEGFQAGLSWLTILRKREGFRRAFASFDPTVVATFGEAEIARLVDDARIVRHRAKITAAVTNARATLALWDRGGSLAALVWQFTPSGPPAPRHAGEVPSSTPESTALSAALRRHGFAFVGPTTVYSAMQSLGVVNDHLVGCHVRTSVESARRALDPSTESGPRA